MPLCLSWEADTRSSPLPQSTVAPAAPLAVTVQQCKESGHCLSNATPDKKCRSITSHAPQTPSHQPTSPPAQKSLRQIRPAPLRGLKFRPTIATPHDDKSSPTQANPPDFSALKQKISNRQNGSRIRLELAPAHLRQGLPLLVWTTTTTPAELSRPPGQEERGRRGKWAKKKKKTEMLTLDFSGFLQPRLHPHCRSDPQVRPQHLPSVLP